MKFTAALGAFAATTALVLAPAAANAETKSHTDATGDVFVSPESDQNGDNFTPATGRVEGDITAIRVSYRPRAVKVVLRYRQLSRTGLLNFDYLRVRSNVSVRQVQVTGFKGKWAGAAEMDNANDKKVACSGLRHTIDYTYDRVTVVIPPSCLGNPRWVRIGAIGGSLDSAYNTYADDARSSSLGENPVLGTRVHRG
jgi:hypothetical protein